MGQHNLQFSALVGSRICHDLISPIGAINNGMELLSMSGTPTSPEMALIAQSVDAANARIRFFRIAYGAPSDVQFMGRSEVSTLLRDLTRDSRLVLHWHPSEDLSRSEVQLVFLAIQCAEQALPYGGRVDIERDQERWKLTLGAERIMLEPELWDALEQDPNAENAALSAIVPAHVQFALLPMQADVLGRHAQYVQSADQVILTV